MPYVLVTTEYRGVFAGEEFQRDDDKREIVLKDARCAIYWATKKGFIELAQVGPNSKSTIGDVAPSIKLFGVTSVVECTAKAEESWRSC
jgi:hypothetical protein